jgi:hypothetical protein
LHGNDATNIAPYRRSRSYTAPLDVWSIFPVSRRDGFRVGRSATYGLWQLAGRSSAAPVHCPLCPAPFPPFVGGLGFAKAGAARLSDVATSVATTARFRFFILSPPPPSLDWGSGCPKPTLGCPLDYRARPISTTSPRRVEIQWSAFRSPLNRSPL